MVGTAVAVVQVADAVVDRVQTETSNQSVENGQSGENGFSSTGVTCTSGAHFC